MTRSDILDGQTAWQSTGGMQIGSIWGHGAYQAPDWSADWLHRELMAWLDLAAEAEYGKPFASVAVDEQARLAYLLKREYRQNTYDEATGTVTVTDRRAQAMADTGTWYQRLHGNDPELRHTRDPYAMHQTTLPQPPPPPDTPPLLSSTPPA